MAKLVDGKWYPKDSSKQYVAQLRVNTTHYEVIVLPETQDQTEGSRVGPTLRGKWSEVSINNRLGNTQRKLNLADGSVFSTLDNDAIDSLVTDIKTGSKSSKLGLLLHHHESKISSVLGMLVFTVIFAFSFIKWGLPWTSHTIAQALPQATGNYIGKQSLEFMDDYFLQPTQISEAQQNKILSRFETRLKPLDNNDNIHYQLHFREMSLQGHSLPNAFALPSGDIVLTDKFVQLSENEDEIDAVLLHEMGHVVHRHSLEMMTQNSLTTMLVILILGNPDGISELATGLGSALVSNHYSRTFETEADEFAFDKMLKGGINPQAFADILNRMESYSISTMTNEQDEGSSQTQPELEAESNNENDKIEDDSLSDFLSTHPNTKLRVKMAEKYSACFDQGLTVCE